MNGERASTIQLTVKVQGAALSPELAESLMSVEVRDSTMAPGSIEVTFEDQRLHLAEGTSIKLGDKLEVVIGAPGVGEDTFAGEVVTLTHRKEGDHVHTSVVRCHDVLHRLSRKRFTTTYEQTTAGDVVRKLCGEAGVAVGTIDATDVTYPTFSVVNETPMEVVRRVSRLAGRQVLVDSKGKLQFTRLDAAAPEPVEIGYDSCLELEVSNHASTIPSEVQARGWDSKTMKGVLGKAAIETKLSKVGKHQPSKAQTLFGTSGAPLVLTGQRPLEQQAEANALAKSLAVEAASQAFEVHGRTYGNPKIRAGAAIKLTGVGAAFNGEHRVTASLHRWSASDGYQTEFHVTGRQDTSLGGLVGGGRSEVRPTIGGLVAAVVTDNKDPDKQGRVKVSYSWLDDKHVSGWARVAYPGAGNKRGLVQRPSVNDEVLVGFAHGDPGAPMVVGGFYNGKTPLPDHKEPAAGRNVHTGLYTDKFGLAVYDQEQQLVIRDVDARFTITVDAKSQAITISSGKDIKLDAKGDISMKATGKISLEATQDIAAKGLNVALESQANTKMKAGAMLDLQASAVAALKGAMTKLG